MLVKTSLKDLDLPRFPVYDTGITMGEIPGELSFCITMRECMRHCPGCHSKDFLWWNGEATEHDTVSTPFLVKQAVKAKAKGATCVCILGGDYNYGVNCVPDLTMLIQVLSPVLPVGLYTSLDTDDASDAAKMAWFMNCTNLKWLKTGEFVQELGGLDKKGTNQRFYERDEKNNAWYDCTYLFRTMKE